jgi:signal transduction histidine kinase
MNRGWPLRSLRFWATLAVLMLVASTVAVAVVAKVESSDAQLAANIALAGAAVVAVTALTLLWYLFTRPISRFLSEIQAVAAGDYTRALSVRGPQEVATIADAVDRMRDGIVQTNAEAVATQQLLGVRHERDRLASDLHDLTIQRIFGLGLALNSTVKRNPDMATELDPLVDETDSIIRELRNVIFALGASEDAAGLRAGVIEIVRDSARSFGFLPELDLRGPLDTAIPADVATDLLAVLREALSNAARHAHASSIRVLLTYADDTVNLVVADDGKGIDENAAPGGGTVTMRGRAARRNGNSTMRRGPSGGTVVHWWVPII